MTEELARNLLAAAEERLKTGLMNIEVGKRQKAHAEREIAAARRFLQEAEVAALPEL